MQENGKDPDSIPHYHTLWQGCPTCGPGTACGPLGPSSKNRSGCEKYYCYLLIVLVYINIADFLFCAPWCELPEFVGCRPTLVLCTLTNDSLLLTTNQCLFFGLHGRRLCTRYWYMEFKTYIQSSGPKKSYIYILHSMSTCNSKFIWEQFDWSPTTIFNPKTWYFNPRTSLANPITDFFALRAAHFVLGSMKFQGTPLVPLIFV